MESGHQRASVITENIADKDIKVSPEQTVIHTATDNHITSKNMSLINNKIIRLVLKTEGSFWLSPYVHVIIVCFLDTLY